MINNKYYIGVHSTHDINDGYMGSGKLLRKAIKAHGIRNFKKEILEYFDSPEQMYARECEVVNTTLINDNMCYNLILGGKGNTKNMCWVEDCNLNRFKVHKNDTRIDKLFFKCSCYTPIDADDDTIVFTSRINPDVISGKLIPTTKNMVCVKNENNEMFRVCKDDPRYLSGELVGINADKLIVTERSTGKRIRINKSEYNKDIHDTNFTGKRFVVNDNGDSLLIPINEQIPNGYKFIMNGKTVVRDDNNNTLVVSVSDPRFLSGELKHVCKGKINVVDEFGNIHHVDKTHPNVISGVWKFMHAGKTAVKDKYGNVFECSTNDPKFLSGEYVSVNAGKVIVRDNNNNTLKVSVSDPRYISGELKHVGFSKGTATMRDKSGKIVRVNKNEINGADLVGTTKGRVSICNIHTGEVICVPVDDPRTKSPDYKYSVQDKIAMYHLTTHKKILIERNDIISKYNQGFRFKYTAYKYDNNSNNATLKTVLENDNVFNSGWKILVNYLNKPKFDLLRKYNLPFPPVHMFTKATPYENIIKGIY